MFLERLEEGIGHPETRTGQWATPEPEAEPVRQWPVENHFIIRLGLPVYPIYGIDHPNGVVLQSGY